MQGAGLTTSDFMFKLKYSYLYNHWMLEGNKSSATVEWTLNCNLIFI